MNRSPRYQMILILLIIFLLSLTACLAHPNMTVEEQPKQAEMPTDEQLTHLNPQKVYDFLQISNRENYSVSLAGGDQTKA